MALAMIKGLHTHCSVLSPLCANLVSVHVVKWSITNGLKFMTNCDLVNKLHWFLIWGTERRWVFVTYLMYVDVGRSETTFLLPQVNSWEFPNFFSKERINNSRVKHKPHEPSLVSFCIIYFCFLMILFFSTENITSNDLIKSRRTS